MPQTSTCPDQRSESVRSFYEQYPYPAHASPTLRSGFDARLVLSYARMERPAGTPLQILDAGCGRGVGLTACGTIHPDAAVVGIDLCRASLADAARTIEQRGLTNTRVQEVDLMTLEGLEVPDGGFDLIYSSGVVHHMSDPVVGLRRLKDVLAPAGVLALMVYGTIGREQVKRVTRALDAWLEPGGELGERLAAGRTLVEALADESDPDCPWHSAAQAPDAEFVDRYLHPLEKDYDVHGLFDLIESAGLRFLKWSVPEQWSLDEHLPAGPLRDSIEALPDRERYAMIEQIVQPPNLQVYLCHADNGRRQLPDASHWGSLVFAVNPEVHFEVGVRNLWRKHRVETVEYMLRTPERIEVEGGALQRACLILATQAEPFLGSTLVDALIEDGDTPEVGLATLVELVRRDVLFVPHAWAV